MGYRRLAWKASFVLAATLVAACALAQAVRIGLISTYSGPEAKYGEQMERDIVQNIYIREVRRAGAGLANIEIDVIPNVKDPWKEMNRKK